MSKELRIGLIALISGALLYYGFNYLKGTDVFANTNRFYVEYPNTDGLDVGSSVKINGVQVGKVSSVVFQPVKNNVLVVIALKGDIQLGDSTIADLAGDGLLGGKAIILLRKTYKELLEPGSFLIPHVDQGILAQAQPAIDNIQTTIQELSNFLKEMKGLGHGLKSTVSHVDTLVQSVNMILLENRGEINGTLSKMDSLIGNLNQAISPMGIAVSNFEALSDSLKNSELKATIATTNNLLKNLNATLDTLTNDQGTIGKLVSEDSVYQNLNRALVNLDKLLIHFNQYPRDFMKPLGRKHDKLEGLKED